MEKKKETELSTFRINKETLDKLKIESKKKKVSLNVLANHILDGHVEFRSAAQIAGFVYVPKKWVTQILSRYSVDESREIASKLSLEYPEAICKILRTEFSAEEHLKALEYWMGDSNIDYKKEVTGNKIKYALYHEMGMNWSWQIAELFRTPVESLTKNKVKVDVTDSTINIEIELD